MKYPSLKNILLIIIAAVIVGGAFLLAEYRNKQSEKILYSAPSLSTTTDALSSDLQNIDSDGDGLKDWEEVLLGTNPHNADTDGDGTPDGKEVGLGRNPLIKGPNDKMTATSTSSLSANENLTPIDKMARDFFANYMQLRQAGLDTDSTSQQDLVSHVLNNGIVFETPRVYSQQNIMITGDSSAVAIKKYGNDIAAILKNNPVTGEDETVIAKESSDKEDPTILKKIDPIIATYKNVIAQLLKTQAPQSMGNLHLSLLNAMSKFLFVAQSLRQSDVDAIKGLQGLNEYLDAGKSLVDSLAAIKSYIISMNISYGPGEPGMLFTNQ